MAKQLPVGGHAARKGTSLNLGRGARGIDGDKGSDFSRKHAQDPWTVKAGDGINPRGAGKYTTDDADSSNDHLLRTSAVKASTAPARKTYSMRWKIKARIAAGAP